ncbi:MAG: deoxyribodipyrimidine photo-lyase [Ahrensia sp.]|nr:deoxyribodipyrimidine photo-lyase [Ahrensia sp.]
MVQVVWFKRDLRIHDHAALAAAASRGKILPLYIIEPGLLEVQLHNIREAGTFL